MRDQYAGDISDFLKFSFLRAVVPAGMELGVVWYYLIGNDGRADGKHTEYLTESEWNGLDVSAYQALGALAKRSVADLEQIDIWPPKVTFFGDAVPSARGRSIWSRAMLSAMKNADVVFIDPDNGISENAVISSKSATLEEVMALSADRRPVVMIRFPHRRDKHDIQLASLHATFASRSPQTLRTTVRVPNRNGGSSPRIRWFTLLNGTDTMLESMRNFAAKLHGLPNASATHSR